ncbi:hypothetical protein PR202_ga28963 [Eleusine coracana subsp. coracana]|uniref:Uncharacterized protein n=1 Tax=Eleusine coracana subsp. coracana TaxID=191504 RepID=A0AAV5DJW5_ELECO|nr:hypothetical protein PR202_ga28963 [Eleusine coracana subsp. coracana]
MARRDGGEDPVQILQLQAYESDRGKGETPERLLNFFVRVVAFIERLGNGLGTLAFTWATVILLGGYPTKLSQRADFVYTTAIVFLEAARMFIRSNNKLDYQLFFHTKELEALIGLSSQTCRVNPEEFAQELKNGHREETFVKSLINTLNANMNPAVHCPGIRRVTIEQAIYLMDYNPYYATLFNKYNMMDALLMVEQTPSSVERYKIFLGDVGFMEHKEPLTNLVSTAKRLMRR